MYPCAPATHTPAPKLLTLFALTEHTFLIINQLCMHRTSFICFTCLDKTFPLHIRTYARKHLRNCNCIHNITAI